MQYQNIFRLMAFAIEYYKDLQLVNENILLNKVRTIYKLAFDDS